MAQHYIDDHVRHQFYVNGLGNGQASDFIEMLADTGRGIRALMDADLPEILSHRRFSRVQREKIARLLKKVRELRGGAFTAFRLDFEEFLRDLAKREINFNRNRLDELPLDVPVNDIDEEAVVTFLLSAGVFAGMTIDEWFSSLQDADADRIGQAVRRGVNNGLSSEEVATGVLGSRNLGYKNGAVNTTNNSARTLARTVVNGVASQSQAFFSMRNGGALARDRYTAILDGRTTFLCASLDGKLFDFGDGPMPPLHFNCRSARIPIPAILDDPSIIGDRPFVRDTRTKKKRMKDFRADARRRVGGERWSEMSVKQRNAEITHERMKWVDANVGIIKSSENWQEWFERQPAWFKKDYLGPTRYNAYKSGEGIGKFAAPSARPYTLEQLEKRGII
jgi:SPP1 gp7 family putative phage head morphogenesis protein